MSPRGRGVAYLALAAAGALWGTGFLFAKVALGQLSVGHMLLYRFLFACLVLVPIAIVRRDPLNRRDLPLWLLTAAIGVPLQFLVQFEGLARTSVSHASLMIGTLPMLLAVAAVLFSAERLDPVGWLLLVGSSLGAGLIVLGARGGDSAGTSVVGDLLVVISLFAAVAWILLSQRLVRRVPPRRSAPTC